MRTTRLLAACTPLFAALLASPALAFNACPGWDDPVPAHAPRYELFASPYTHHWRFDPEHRQVALVSLSRRLPDRRLCGAALFTNSFGQPSAYAFMGKTWDDLVPGRPQIYATISAGIIYGYVGEYKDKVPLNVGGFAPVIIPSVGYRFTPRLGMEVQILGTAAFMVGINGRF